MLWPKETDGAYCVRSDGRAPWDANDQAGCQYLCEKRPTCIGISYESIKGRDVINCRMCADDKLTSSDSYSFYRRPGRSILYSLNKCNLEITFYLCIKYFALLICVF